MLLLFFFFLELFQVLLFLMYLTELLVLDGFDSDLLDLKLDSSKLDDIMLMEFVV